MKNVFKTAVLLACAIVTVSCGAFTKVSDAEKASFVKAIKHHNYTLSVNTVVPTGYPFYQVSGDYELKVNGKKVTTRLPFVGDAHQAIIGGVDEMSIVFDNESVQFADDFSNGKKEGKYITKFTGHTGNTTWEVTLELYDEGSATIRCNSSVRGYMSYYADIVLNE